MNSFQTIHKVSFGSQFFKRVAFLIFEAFSKLWQWSSDVTKWINDLFPCSASSLLLWFDHIIIKTWTILKECCYIFPFCDASFDGYLRLPLDFSRLGLFLILTRGSVSWSSSITTWAISWLVTLLVAVMADHRCSFSWSSSITTRAISWLMAFFITVVADHRLSCSWFLVPLWWAVFWHMTNFVTIVTCHVSFSCSFLLRFVWA